MIRFADIRHQARAELNGWTTERLQEWLALMRTTMRDVELSEQTWLRFVCHTGVTRAELRKRERAA